MHLSSPTGQAGISERLRSFVAEFPYERESILAFMLEAASQTPPGARVLDVGAGDSPYSELFSHTEYLASDWEESVHAGAKRATIVASADCLPLPSEDVDVVLLTQVLEHVPGPAPVLAEMHRVLRPGGRIHLTAPLVWELHEVPHDYYRYTEFGLYHLIAEAGFLQIEIAPRNDCFTSVAQLLRNLRYAMGRAADGLDPKREEASQLLDRLVEPIAALAPLDTRFIFPLGYQATATRPAP